MINDSGFQQALATSADDFQFAYLPVDWWDAPSYVWRTVILESLVKTSSDSKLASVITPNGGDISAGSSLVTRTVAIKDLRLSRNLDEGMQQFLTVRYTLDLVKSLKPCIDSASEEEQCQIAEVVADLNVDFERGYLRWSEAYLRGCPDSISRALESTESALLRGATNQLRGGHGERVDLLSAVAAEQASGAIVCAPVALWDESAARWRATLMLNATGDSTQFLPQARAKVLVPGRPVDVLEVSGAVVQPLDIPDSCFSLIALPVIARDLIRIHDALLSARLSAAEVQQHPSVVGLVKLLDSAADEWVGLFEDGMDGPAPQPRVVPIDPALWGLSYDDNQVWRDQAVSS